MRKIPKYKKKPNFKTLYFTDFTKVDNLVKWIINNRAKKHNNRKYPIKIIHINLERCRFLKPYHIAPLACLIHEYQEKGFKIVLEKIPDHIKEYFNSFNFNQFCSNGHQNNIPAATDCKTLPLWKIEEGASHFYTDRAKRYFENNHFDGKSLYPLSISMAELMNNIFDHSGSSIPGYTFTQYNTRFNSIITCVCDFGVGIPHRVNEYLKENNKALLTSSEALSKAFELAFSTQTKPHNRGYGLDNIVSNVKSLNSKMLVISNNALYRLLPGLPEQKIILSENFPGTLVVLWLNTDCLPIKEEELTDELTIL